MVNKHSAWVCFEIIREFDPNKPNAIPMQAGLREIPACRRHGPATGTTWGFGCRWLGIVRSDMITWINLSWKQKMSVHRPFITFGEEHSKITHKRLKWGQFTALLCSLRGYYHVPYDLFDIVGIWNGFVDSRFSKFLPFPDPYGLGVN